MDYPWAGQSLAAETLDGPCRKQKQTRSLDLEKDEEGEVGRYAGMTGDTYSEEEGQERSDGLVGIELKKRKKSHWRKLDVGVAENGEDRDESTLGRKGVTAQDGGILVEGEGEEEHQHDTARVPCGE